MKIFHRIAALSALGLFSMLTVACGGDDDITAENVTLEQCKGFEDDETDLDGDGESETDEDKAIAERCVELLLEEANGGGGAGGEAGDE